MVEGGNEDAEYLAWVMEDGVKKYDTYKTCTVMIYFDGSINVQKSVRGIFALYPRAYIFHGGENVISLLFSDVAKLPTIKARIFFLISWLFLFAAFVWF